MKSSCISHPASEPLIIIRKWQITACDGNFCAAALLSFFEYWHNIRLDQCTKAMAQNAVAMRHGEDGTQDESLLQFHTAEDLRNGILGMYSERSIPAALELLTLKGFISIHKNPNPRYAFDATKYFLFHPEAAKEWLPRPRSELAKLPTPSCKIADRAGNSAERAGKIAEAITESTSETTTERGIHVPPNGKSLGKTEIVLHDKELNRVNQKIDLLRHQYSDHQTWTPTDSAEFSRLKRRKTELMSILGLQA